MSVLNISLSPTNWGGTYSAYGSVGWSKALQAVIPPNYGTNWVIWQIGASGLAAGEPINGINVNGINTFLVAAGATRTATLIANALNNFNAFNGANGPALDTLPGDGTRKTVNATFAPSGLTTNDLLNGSVFFGVAVTTSNAQATLGNGTFTYGALAVQIFTGTDGANPPPTAASGVWKNPASNNNPGKLAGLENFSSLNYRLASPIPQTFFNMQFQIMGSSSLGIRFPNGTSTSPSYLKGAQGADPSHPYDQDTGILTIDAGVAPGTYTIRCQTNGGAGVLGGAGLLDYNTLVVRAPDVSAGILLMEF